MKKVEFPLFGENEYMFLNIGRLIDIERMSLKMKRENQSPASLGNAYFREER